MPKHDPGRRARDTSRPGPYPAYEAEGPPQGADYDYDFAGYTGEIDQDEYGDDQHGGGAHGRGPYEQSQRFGASGFSTGEGPYGELQRQYENRYVSGGYRGSYGDFHGRSGPGDYSAKQRAHEGEFWHGRDNATADHPTGDTGTRRLTQPPYYGALAREDEQSARSRRPAARMPGDRPGVYRGHEADRYRPAAPPPSFGRGGSRPAPLSPLDIRYGSRPMRGTAGGAPTPRSAPSGPRNYRRSDERIREDICERLTIPLERFDHAGRAHLDASDVSVTVRDGTVTLEGTVSARQMKHQIEDIVDGVAGVREIENRIRVPRT